MSDFTHFNDQGRARMVDVGEKNITRRTSTAMARVFVNENTFALITPTVLMPTFPPP